MYRDVRASREAAHIVGKWTGKSVNDLRKKKAGRVSAGLLAKRYLKYHKIFTGKLPGDVEQVIVHAKKSRKMFKKEPTTMRYSLQGKDGPWKNNLLDSFQRQKRKKNLTVEQRARANFELLANTCKKMHMVDCSAWPNLRVAHVMGFVTMCLQLGIICKTKKNKPGVIRLRKNFAFAYEISSGKRKAAALSKLEKDVHAAGAIADMGAAHSLVDCVRNMTTAVNKLKEHPSTLLNPGGKNVPVEEAPYSVKWTVRSAIISHMRGAGRKRMVIKKGDSVSLLQKAFPDQNTYVKRVSKKLGTSSVRQLFSKMKYKDPAEFFSMYMCFYGSPTLDKYDHLIIGKKQVSEAKKYLEKSKKKLGVYLTPPEAIKKMVEEGVLQ